MVSRLNPEADWSPQSNSLKKILINEGESSLVIVICGHGLAKVTQSGCFERKLPDERPFFFYSAAPGFYVLDSPQIVWNREDVSLLSVCVCINFTHLLLPGHLRTWNEKQAKQHRSRTDVQKSKRWVAVCLQFVILSICPDHCCGPGVVFLDSSPDCLSLSLLWLDRWWPRPELDSPTPTAPVSTTSKTSMMSHPVDHRG